MPAANYLRAHRLTPSDTEVLHGWDGVPVAGEVYSRDGGTVVFEPAGSSDSDEPITIVVGERSWVPGEVRKVYATGTTSEHLWVCWMHDADDAVPQLDLF